VDAYPRYASAFGADRLATLFSGPSLAPTPASEAVPASLYDAALPQLSARREILSRFLALAGPISVADVLERYDFDAAWIESLLEHWQRHGTLVRGTFGRSGETRWVPRRLLEQARRRELAQARKQIAAVTIPDFARFLQRWQHLAPDTQLSGHEGTASVLSQLYGLARPAEAWERDYLPSRLAPYDPAALGALAASGRLAWAADPPVDGRSEGPLPPPTVGRIRFFERGTGRLWMAPPVPDARLSDTARDVLGVLRSQGASFTADLAAATASGPQRLRDALYELVAAGLVTNDTIDALRDVLRWRPVFPVKRREDPDPTRWLPADFTPSPNRPVVQRRVNPRRMARWQRPDRPGAAQWGGRWSLVHTPGVLGADDDIVERAEDVARQWLARYGVVSRELWRRERPSVSWREIYHALKRLEFRGDVRRGYFVAGLAGAQFALPEAVELLRAPPPETLGGGASEPVAFVSSDPANVYALPLTGDAEADPLSRPRGTGAMLVTINGVVIVSAEGRGKRLRVREGASAAQARDAVAVLLDKLVTRDRLGRRHEIIVETIDGESASASSCAGAGRCRFQVPGPKLALLSSGTLTQRSYRRRAIGHFAD
jgi:ATP-dependent Lhr-like helicase